MASFKKNYTRDSSVIIQQAYFNVMGRGVESFGWHNPHLPAVVHYVHDGVIEVWENEKATQWLVDELYKENSKNAHFFDDVVRTYRDELTTLKAYWAAGPTTDVGELEKMVGLVFDALLGFIVMYYSAGDERTPTEIRSRALALRDEDVFFDASVRFISGSLVAVYPRLEGLESMVLRNEIADPPQLSVLKERYKHFVVIGEVESSVATLEEFAKTRPEFDFQFERPPDSAVTELRGQTAQGGMVRGVVRILKRKEQIDDVREGDIIVSPMTTPDYMPAMKRAAAFVTDEGGIICHAGIVARELKKPCVIGTKFATQVLKDGDEVEVDADNGVVRILSTEND